MDVRKLLLIGVIFLMLAIPVKAEITYDETTESNCWFDENNLKHCWKALYSGYSPSFFKDVIFKETNWLKFYDVVYLERDEKSDIIIKSFNATDIDFQLKTVQSEMSKSIPFYACKDDPSSKESVCYQMNYVLNSLSRDYHLGIGLLEYRFLKFGLASTTIMLQDADTENLDDTYAREGSGLAYGGSTYNYVVLSNVDGFERESYTKFSLSSLPNGITIINAKFYWYINYNGLDSGTEGFNVSSKHVFCFPTYNISNYEWTEGNANGGSPGVSDMIWDRKPTTNELNNTMEDTVYMFGGTGEPFGWQYLSVTNMVSKAYSDGDNNITILLDPHDYFGTPSSSDTLYIKSKEYGGNQTPYLNITYEEAAGQDYSYQINLSLNWSDPTNRTFNGVRKKDLVITYSDSTYRTLDARRLGTLTLSWNDDIVATALKIYSRLISLTLGWNENTYRTLDANREVDQTITFTSSGDRTLTANRLAELSIGWSDETYVKALKIFNRLVSLALGWSDETSRELDAVRTVDQTITFTDIGSRILTANRGASLSLAWSDNTYSSLSHFFNRLITLALTWNDPTNRTLDAERGAVQSLTFTGNAERTADMIREGSLPIGWSDNTYRTLEAVREIDLILTWLDNVIVVPPGAQDFVRIITLLLNLDFDQTTYIKSWESVDPYEICSVLKQIGESRAYLCIYQDASYKILIRGV